MNPAEALLPFGYFEKNSAHANLISGRSSSNDFYILTQSKLRFYMKGLASTGGDNAWTSSVLPVNTWTHVAITYSLSDGEIRHYINGEPDATHKFNSNAKIRFDRALRLGVQWNNHNKLNGQLDDLLIYADALTPWRLDNFEGTRPGFPGDYQFKISGNRLLTNGFFDYEQRDEVLLRVKTRDRAGGTCSGPSGASR